MADKLKRIGWAVAAAVLAAGGVQVVTAAPAVAVPGLIRMPGIPTADNDQVDKSVSVLCPVSSPRIVGGGIVIDDHGQRRAFARFMQPTKNAGPNGEDRYSVGATVPPGFVGTYRLQAIAVCASNAGVPGHEVRAGTPSTPPSSAAAQDAVAGCSSSTKKVLGFGGGVLNGGRQVGLQTVRADKPRGISRTFAQENSNYTPLWQVQSFVICMTSNDTTPPSGAAIPGDTASTLCANNPNQFVHGPGGGAWDGTGLIHQILPSANLKLTTVIITPGSTAAFTSAICIT